MSEPKKKRKMKQNAITYLFVGCGLIVLLLVLLLVQWIRPGKVYKPESKVDMVEMTSIESAKNVYDTVGWVTVQGTGIDLPIVKCANDENDYPVELEGYSWLSNDEATFHNNLRVFGHNVFNLSSQPAMKSEDFERFEELMSFLYYDFAKENQFFQITIDGKDYIYRIFEVAFVPVNDIYYYPLTDDYTTEELDHYLEKNMKYSLYQYNVDVDGEDDIASLTTCSRFFGMDTQYQFTVFGRLLREGEKPKNVGISKTSNYKKIEEKLKGDDEDEEA